MMLVLPYCHKDADQAFRLLRWIGFLSTQNRQSMKAESILIAASSHASKLSVTTEICDLASGIFGEARFFTPTGENETGWPGSCNFMFASALRHIEENFQDAMFWLEPDAIPIASTWFDIIQDEWEVAIERGKSFMGAYVKKSIPHMTGVAVYGANWRSLAPSLETAPDKVPWDLHSAREVLPHAWITHLIQHISSNPHISDLDILSGSSVIFHQDKAGALIRLLDLKVYSGHARDHPIFGRRSQAQPKTVFMTKFYHAENANRRIKKDGYEFIFEPYEIFGGTWMGTYMTDKEGEIIALDSIVAQPRYAITEISLAEYEQKAKKKVTAEIVSTALKIPSQLRVNQSPAVLVEAPSPSLNPETPNQALRPMDEFLKLDSVKIDNQDAPKKRGRPKKI